MTRPPLYIHNLPHSFSLSSSPIPSPTPPPSGSGLCARFADAYTVLCSPLSPFRRIVSDGTTTRFCIYIQPFVTVRAKPRSVRSRATLGFAERETERKREMG